VIFEYCSSGNQATGGEGAAPATGPTVYDGETRPVTRAGWSSGQVGLGIAHLADPEIDEELPWRSA
jgi:hypothetical protein